ncbi:MGMT family protein [Desulfobaculum sp. SPO524]|uniref:MGMT family protein n=1 Tax=Desulfobaculum sp. SPO524 TaxID=3378071 RepID=UPI003854BEFA
MTHHPFTRRIIEVIRRIPRGRVATYGGVARLAGNARAARQVTRVLHTLSQKEGLPWQRVINREGRISLRPGAGYETQRRALQAEGVHVDDTGRVNLEEYLWTPNPAHFALEDDAE